VLHGIARVVRTNNNKVPVMGPILHTPKGHAVNLIFAVNGGREIVSVSDTCSIIYNGYTGECKLVLQGITSSPRLVIQDRWLVCRTAAQRLFIVDCITLEHIQVCVTETEGIEQVSGTCLLYCQSDPLGRRCIFDLRKRFTWIKNTPLDAHVYICHHGRSYVVSNGKTAVVFDVATDTELFTLCCSPSGITQNLFCCHLMESFVLRSSHSENSWLIRARDGHQTEICAGPRDIKICDRVKYSLDKTLVVDPWTSASMQKRNGDYHFVYSLCRGVAGVQLKGLDAGYAVVRYDLTLE